MDAVYGFIPKDRSHVAADTLHGKPLAPDQDGMGLHTNQPISAGASVLISMMNIRAIVHSGQHVRIIAIGGGGCRGRFRCRAQNGKSGEKIEVENAVSHQRLEAKAVVSSPMDQGA